MLWLVSTGFALSTEIQRLLVISEHVDPSSGALRRLMPGLIKKGVLQVELAAINNQIKLRLLALGPESHEIIRRLKWQPVENEWQRLARLHEKGKEAETRHTLAVIAFVYHARLRGYQAGVMPAVAADGLISDAIVIDGTEQTLVEVERTGYQKFSKWENLATYQGYVALCARTEKQRQRLVRENDWDLGISGRATDLQTLFSNSWEPPYGPLWVETW